MTPFTYHIYGIVIVLVRICYVTCIKKIHITQILVNLVIALCFKKCVSDSIWGLNLLQVQCLWTTNKINLWDKLFYVLHPPICCSLTDPPSGRFSLNRNMLENVWYFFFFHWHYSPLWALACWTISFHFFLSVTSSLHLLILSTWRYLSTSSFHPFLGLPLRLVPSSSWVKIFLQPVCNASFKFLTCHCYMCIVLSVF